MSEFIVSVDKFSSRHKFIVKFILVGTWNTALGYGLFCILDTLFTWIFSSRSAAYMWAMVFSLVLSITSAYICHKYISFKSPAKGKQIIAEYFRFFTTYSFIICLNLTLLPALVEVLRIHPKIAAAVTTLLCTVISYLGHSRFSFRK